MTVSPLVRAELGRHDWASMACLCGQSAEHVPELFEIILAADSPADLTGWTLDGHVQDGGPLAECTGPGVGVIVAALSGDLPPTARNTLLGTLTGLAHGLLRTAHQDARPDVEEECRAAVREGYWPLLHIGLTGSADDAEDVETVLRCFDLDERRSGHYRQLLRERALAMTKRRARR